MESLIHIVGKIDVIKHPSFVLPHFVISSDTCSLENSYHWIQIWNQNYNDWHDNIKSHANDQELSRRENSLQKLLKTSHKNIEDYPRILAEWASKAGDFPTFKVKINGTSMELADYWESIIIKCAKEETVFHVNENDLRELIEHCEDNIIAEGSIYAMALMKYLRKGQSMQRNYLGLGDIDLASKEGTAYRILKPETSAADANIQNMIDNAPATKPEKHKYPTLIDYIKALGRWNMAQNYKITSTVQSAQLAQSPTNPSEDNI